MLPPQHFLFEVVTLDWTHMVLAEVHVTGRTSWALTSSPLHHNHLNSLHKLKRIHSAAITDLDLGLGFTILVNSTFDYITDFSLFRSESSASDTSDIPIGLKVGKVEQLG